MSNHAGPIVFSNPYARQQLLEHGTVVTFRAGTRTTGETWWRESRTGPKEGDCTVKRIKECVPREEELEPYADESGFPQLNAWQRAIVGYHDGLPAGGLYRATEGHILG